MNLLLGACTKEEIYVYPWTDSLHALMDEYFNGGYYVSGSSSSGNATLKFGDGMELSLTKEEIKIYDLAFRDVPLIAVDYSDNTWTVNRVRTGIPVKKELSDRNAFPLCVWFDKDALDIYLNNGRTMVISCEPGQVLSSFSFMVAENPGLDLAIKCSINGFDVVGNRPVSLKTTRLVPTFVYRGKSIKVDGEEQKSGFSKQDFSAPVKYDIEMFNGEVVSYVVTLKTVLDFPTIFIDTDNNHPITSKDSYVSGSIRVEDPFNLYSDVSFQELRMQIKGRGNTTWGMPKKPYRIKLDEKASVFGLPKNRDWVLLANYSDKSLMRNMLAMKLSEIVGMKWTPAVYPVEVYLNNEYMGCYTFGDHKEVAKHRVDIDVVKPDDQIGDYITGGYYFEIEQQLDELMCFTTGMGIPMMFIEPELPTTQQFTYVKNYFRDFESALQSDDFANPQTGYANYIDVPSFINYYIVEEIAKDIDGNLRKSTFITKERNSKLEMYHLWDFDIAFGNCDYFQNYGLDNTYKDFFIMKYGPQGRRYGWYYRLFKEAGFLQQTKNRWNELYPQLLAVQNYIDETAAYLTPAANRNFKRWPILSTYVWPNCKVTGSYQKEVDYLKDFYMSRITWLNENLNGLTL